AVALAAEKMEAWVKTINPTAKIETFTITDAAEAWDVEKGLDYVMERTAKMVAAKRYILERGYDALDSTKALALHAQLRVELAAYKETLPGNWRIMMYEKYLLILKQNPSDPRLPVMKGMLAVNDPLADAPSLTTRAGTFLHNKRNTQWFLLERKKEISVNEQGVLEKGVFTINFAGKLGNVLIAIPGAQAFVSKVYNRLNGSFKEAPADTLETLRQRVLTEVVAGYDQEIEAQMQAWEKEYRKNDPYADYNNWDASHKQIDGGIDLNAAKMILSEKGGKVVMAFDPAMLAQFRSGDFSGVRPEIINITPISNMPSLMGLKS
ncbi:MAG: hypothetical protein WCI27_10185, partial [Candidatus Omnitrophota bacterium]